MAKNPKFFGKEFPLSWNEMIICGALALLGLVLIIFPGITVKLVIGGIGGVGIIMGAIHLIKYFRMEAHASLASNDLAIGLIWLAGGILVIALHKFLLSIVPVFFGVVLLMGGIAKIQSTLQFKRMGAKRWYFELVCAGLSVGFGVIILLNPFNTALLLMRIIGIALLIEGTQNLVSRYIYKKTSDAYYVEFEKE